MIIGHGSIGLCLAFNELQSIIKQSLTLHGDNVGYQDSAGMLSSSGRIQPADQFCHDLIIRITVECLPLRGVSPPNLQTKAMDTSTDWFPHNLYYHGSHLSTIL